VLACCQPLISVTTNELVGAPVDDLRLSHQQNLIPLTNFLVMGIEREVPDTAILNGLGRLAFGLVYSI
jgi:hypothetical protein